jgi:hypothetical protein
MVLQCFKAQTLDITNKDHKPTFVAWNWKANGAGVSNTDGSITSTVSANPTAGFSVVTYIYMAFAENPFKNSLAR